MTTFVYDFVIFTAAPGLLWFRPKRIYENEAAKKVPKGGVLMVCNHNTLFDPLYLMLSIWKRRHHYVCTDELMNTKFNRWLFRHFLTIPIDRKNFAMSSFREITSNLKEGNMCVIFPEGHVVRDEDGEGDEAADNKKKLEKNAPMVDNLKSGMVMMAFSSGAPIWPVYLKPRTGVFERVKVAIGDPIDVKSLLGKMPTMERINEVTAMITEKENYLKSICK